MHTHLEKALGPTRIYVQQPAKWVELIRQVKHTTPPALILLPVSVYYSVSIESMRGKWRKHEIVLARQMAMFMLRKFTKFSLKDIGMMLGDRDHTTVIHSCKTIEDLRDTDHRIRMDIEILTEKIKDYIY